MKKRTDRKNYFLPKCLRILPIVLILLTACGSPDPEPQEPSTAPPKGFTFFGLHADSILSNEIRDTLSDRLGSAAKEARTTLDLEMHYNGFLETYFQELNPLNQRLNFEKGLRIRIEHHTIKLTYRYSSSFNHVELFFSDFTKKPLLFRIKGQGDGTDIVETFRKKYGTPREIIWKNEEGRSLLWKQNKDVLITSLFSDRYGDPRYEIMIVHVENIEALLSAEEKAGKQRESDRLQKGDSAF